MALLFNDIDSPAAAANFVIKDGTTQGFKADVVEESKSRIVFAYFYSPTNCAACKQFTPILEKYIKLANGKAILVKFSVEENQQLAMQLGVQSVPTTMIFAKGGLVDGFAGAISETQLKTVMQALIGKDALSLDQMLKEANEKLQEGDINVALEGFTAVLEKDELNSAAFAGMIRAFIQMKQLDAAQDLVDGLEETIKSPELEAAKTALKLAIETKDAPSPDELAEKVKKNPDDLRAAFDYAVALFAAGEAEKSIDALIDIFRKDREWNNDAARQQLFKIFASLGNTNPITVAGRRKLSSLIFS